MKCKGGCKNCATCPGKMPVQPKLTDQPKNAFQKLVKQMISAGTDKLLADYMGCSITTVARWESGIARPHPKIQKMIVLFIAAPLPPDVLKSIEGLSNVVTDDDLVQILSVIEYNNTESSWVFNWNGVRYQIKDDGFIKNKTSF